MRIAEASGLSLIERQCSDRSEQRPRVRAISQN
jgi:hypothetical protein